MDYIGNWSNLRRDINRTKEKIASAKSRAKSRSENYRKGDKKKAVEIRRSQLSLVEKRYKTMNKIRIILLLLLATIVFIFYKYL